MLPTDICFQVVLTVTGDLCPCHISLFQSVLRLGCIFFLLTVCLHARGFILCVLAFHPHRKWSFPPPPETLFCVYMWTRKTRILACNVKLVHLHLLFQCQTVSHFIALTGPPMATIGQHLYTARPWVTTCWYQILHTHIKWHINRKLSHAI